MVRVKRVNRIQNTDSYLENRWHYSASEKKMRWAHFIFEPLTTFEYVCCTRDVTLLICAERCVNSYCGIQFTFNFVAKYEPLHNMLLVICTEQNDTIDVVLCCSWYFSIVVHQSFLLVDTVPFAFVVVVVVDGAGFPLQYISSSFHHILGTRSKLLTLDTQH